MKPFFHILSLFLLLNSCSDTHDLIDPTSFNEKIESRTDITTAEQLIEIYYDYPPTEGIPLLAIKSKELSNGQHEVCLIHDGHQDDALRATKIVMTAELTNKTLDRP